MTEGDVIKLGDLVSLRPSTSTDGYPDPIGVVVGCNHFQQRVKVYWPEVSIADWEPAKWLKVVSPS